MLDAQLTTMKSDHSRIDGDLNTITKLPPNAVSLVKTSQSADTLNVTGIASDKYSIYEYARSLMNSKRFVSVVVASIDAKQETKQVAQPGKQQGAEPDAPTTLAATAAPASAGTVQVNLKWVDNSNNETGFLTQRATNEAFSLNVTTFTVDANVTTYTDNTAVPGTTYYYRILARNIAGDSEPSSPVNVTPTLAVPLAPGQLIASAEKPEQAPPVTQPGTQPVTQPETQVVYNFEIVIKLKQPPKPTPTPTPKPVPTPAPKPTPTPSPAPTK